MDEDEQDEAQDDDYANNFGGMDPSEAGGGLGNIDFSKLGGMAGAGGLGGMGAEGAEGAEGGQEVSQAAIFQSLLANLSFRMMTICLSSRKPTRRPGTSPRSKRSRKQWSFWRS